MSGETLTIEEIQAWLKGYKRWPAANSTEEDHLQALQTALHWAKRCRELEIEANSRIERTAIENYKRRGRI